MGGRICWSCEELLPKLSFLCVSKNRNYEVINYERDNISNEDFQVLFWVRPFDKQLINVHHHPKEQTIL